MRKNYKFEVVVTSAVPFTSDELFEILRQKMPFYIHGYGVQEVFKDVDRFTNEESE